MPPKKVKATIVALVVAFLWVSSASHADELEQMPLRGLKGVKILVEKTCPDTERFGLSRDQIKTDIELKLRKAGIKILTEKDWREAPGYPYLYVNVNTMIKGETCVHSIKVELKELVTLARGFKTLGTIWDKGSVGIVGVNKIRQIRDGIGDEIDKFINDYLAANHK